MRGSVEIFDPWLRVKWWCYEIVNTCYVELNVNFACSCNNNVVGTWK